MKVLSRRIFPNAAINRSPRSFNTWLITCEGGGDVVGVVTPLVGGVAQAFHDDRVVELRVQLGVQEVEGKDREEQVEVERERRVKEGAPMDDYEDVYDKTQILSQ